MQPIELWWLFDAKKPPQMYGSMSEREAESMYQFLKRKKANE